MRVKKSSVGPVYAADEMIMYRMMDVRYRQDER